MVPEPRSPGFGPLSSEHGRTRAELARVAAHVLARRRFAATGRFGLRAVPGGIATPQFGDETLRITGTTLLRERRVDDRALTLAHPLAGTTLAAAAAFAEVELDDAFRVGHDTPPLGDAHAPLVLDPGATSALLHWFATAAAALDEIVASTPEADASVAQLWPEHFDLALDVAAGPGRANLGASAGDSFHDEPYLYVGPWDARRPGEPAFWNAPFGAVMGYRDVASSADPAHAMVDFWRRGLTLLG